MGYRDEHGDDGAPIPNTQYPIPNFVICGNVARDIVPGGWMAGGTALYAATVALGLGRQVGVVTAAPADVVAAGLPDAAAVARAETERATTFENIYTARGRVQYLRDTGVPIPASLMPAAWEAARVALIGPVFHEVDAALVRRFRGTAGICAQGFLRRRGSDDRISALPACAWDALPVLRHATVLFLSEEDVEGGIEALPPLWLETVPITVLTDGPEGARVHTAGGWQHVPAYPAQELDPTGAGDSFAAAFLIALDDGATPVEAARFAAAVASLAVEVRGAAWPSNAEARARMRA